MYKVPLSVKMHTNIRPVGVAFDAKNRLYVSSDASGEIFRIRYTNTSLSTGSGSASTGTKNSFSAFVFAFIVVLVMTLAFD